MSFSIQQGSLSNFQGPFFLGGVQVNEPDLQAWVDGLKTANFNTVEVTVYAYQQQWDSENLKIDSYDKPFIEEIRLAKAKGLRVNLLLRIGLNELPENKFLWHGQIMPRTDEQLQRWFDRYGEFVAKWAAIAEAEGVDVLGLGNEMASLTATVPIQKIPELEDYYLNNETQERKIQTILNLRDKIPLAAIQTGGAPKFESLEDFLETRRQAQQAWAKQVSYVGASDRLGKINQRRKLLDKHWRQLIQRTRSVYGGKLTLAANFNEYEFITFWDALDYIGINAYFSLRNDLEVRTPKQQAKIFERSWGKTLGNIDKFRQAQGIQHKPIIFTELGYTRTQNSTVEPWAYSGFSLTQPPNEPDVIFWSQQPLNLQERVLAIEALYKVQKRDFPNLLQGILYWKLSTQPNHINDEPYVLILNQSPIDPLQSSLKKFIRNED